MFSGRITRWQAIRPRAVAFLLAAAALPLYLGSFAVAWCTSDVPGQSTNIVTRGLQSETISLISASSATFSTVLRNLARDKYLAAKELPPFLVILSNRSPNKIVAYALLWKLKRDTGAELTQFVQFKYPDAVAGVPDTGAISLADRSDGSIASGDKKIVAMEFEFQPPLNAPDWSTWIHQIAEWQKQQYADVHSVEVDLDAVIFSNGVLSGPDSSELSTHFSTYLAAKQELFRQIAARLNSGSTVEEAFRAIDSMAQPKPSDDINDLSLFYHRLAAQEIRALRKRVGDQDSIVICKEAVREQPFVVRRGSGSIHTTKGEIR